VRIGSRQAVNLISSLRCVSIAAGAACLLAVGGGCGGGDNPVETVKTVPAVIDAVSTTTVAPGDTVIITGHDFGSTAASNRVVFNNNLGAAIPYLVAAERLELVVPQNAATGPMWIEKDGTRSNEIAMEVVRSVGDVWVVGSTSTSFTFKLPAATGTEQYLIIPHSASQQASEFDYHVTPGDAAQYPAPRRAPAAGSEPYAGSICLDGRLSELLSDAVKHMELSGGFLRQQSPSQGALLDTMQFSVLNTLDPGYIDAGDFTAVTAVLKQAGRRCYIYSDVNSPDGGFQASDYASFADSFDRQGGIYATDSTFFGPPSDMDNNGIVVILFSPVVNTFTPPGTAQTSGVYTGFFNYIDLLSSLPAGTSNKREIFYMFVPDPLGEFGNQLPVDRVRSLVVPTLAHEFEHMISAGYRIFHYGLNYIQATWLEEGMAHMAEDANGMNESNEGRIRRYLPDPGAIPMMENQPPSERALEQRAAIYLFLRYVADRLGPGILKQMVQTSKKGTGTVELVTGEDFFTTFADWLATLYLSGRGITADPKYRYTSIDLLDGVTYPTPLMVVDRSAAQGVIADAVYGAAGDFFVLQDPSPPALEVTADNFTLSAALRLVVVRIQ
jgi:hypothetical protein